jgi:nickel-type superoxide dismutase maturation protease
MGDDSGSGEIRTQLLPRAGLVFALLARGLLAVAPVALALVLGSTLVKLLFRSRRVVVQGSSMAPTLLPGDRLVVVPARKPRIGDVVAVADPRDPERLLVKRVIGVDPPDSTLIVAGDNPEASTGSATFGPVAHRTVLGRATYRYFPVERAGRIRRRPTEHEPAPLELPRDGGSNAPRG